MPLKQPDSQKLGDQASQPTIQPAGPKHVLHKSCQFLEEARLFPSMSMHVGARKDRASPNKQAWKWLASSDQLDSSPASCLVGDQQRGRGRRAEAPKLATREDAINSTLFASNTLLWLIMLKAWPTLAVVVAVVVVVVVLVTTTSLNVQN